MFKTREEAETARTEEYGDPKGERYSIEEVDENGFLI
jgi:hypothetical protein